MLQIEYSEMLKHFQIFYFWEAKPFEMNRFEFDEQLYSALKEEYF